jgi:hypothetical protein
MIGEWGVGQLISIPHSPFRSISLAADPDQFVAPSAGFSVVAAEDRTSVVLFPVVATEVAAPSGLRGDIVLYDCRRRWRVLVFRRRSAEAGEGAVAAPNYWGGISPAGAGFIVTWSLCSGRL